MYVTGRKDRGADATSALADVDALVGRSIDLSRVHARFEKPESTGLWPPEQFDGITVDSSPADAQKAVEWVDDLVGWFHSVDLPQGVTTPGGRGWQTRAQIFDIADRVAGASVLDLGAMEGGDTFCAEDAGAHSVTACDVDNYFGYDLGGNIAWDYVVDRYLTEQSQGPEREWAFLNSKRIGFELCRRARGSKATRLSAPVYELDPLTHGVFDVTYCFGLLYHLRHPLLAIDRLRAVTGQVALVNNQITHEGDGDTVRFYADTWRGSYTNWFVPTPEAFLGMLSSSGFARLEVVDLTANSMSVVCHV